MYLFCDRDPCHHFILPGWRPPGNQVATLEISKEDADIVQGVLEYAIVCKQTVKTLSLAWEDFRDDQLVYHMIKFICISHSMISNMVISSHVRHPIQKRMVSLAELPSSIFAGLNYEVNYMRYVMTEVTAMASNCYQLWFERGRCAEYTIDNHGINFNRLEPILHPICGMALCPDYMLLSNLMITLESIQAMMDILFSDPL